MVDMAVSEPDLLHGDAGLLDGVQDLRHVAAGIDHHGLLGRLVPDDGAILLEQRHGDDDRARLRACLGLCLVLLCHGATMPIFAMPPSKRFAPGVREQSRTSSHGRPNSPAVLNRGAPSAFSRATSSFWMDFPHGS